MFYLDAHFHGHLLLSDLRDRGRLRAVTARLLLEVLHQPDIEARHLEGVATERQEEAEMTIPMSRAQRIRGHLHPLDGGGGRAPSPNHHRDLHLDGEVHQVEVPHAGGDEVPATVREAATAEVGASLGAAPGAGLDMAAGGETRTHQVYRVGMHKISLCPSISGLWRVKVKSDTEALKAVTSVEVTLLSTTLSGSSTDVC